MPISQKKIQLREQMIQSFRQAGFVHNQKVQPNSLENLLDKEDKKRLLLIVPESLGDCYIVTSLLPELKNKYEGYSIYLATKPQYFEVFQLNEYLKGTIPWTQELENELFCTGYGEHKGLFNTSIHVTLGTQRILNYISSKY